jgi:hypothetical protein
LRTGWYPDQPGLNPSAGGDCSFGELWSSAVDGQVYAQPLVDPGATPNGTLLVATETNNIYGFDAVTGQELWHRDDLGAPWSSGDLGCTDLFPAVGVTSTPAIDPVTHTAYLFSKRYEAGTSGPAAWYAHALDLTNSGAEKAGFPRKIEGFAANVPNLPPGAGASFDATMHLQRPGLLLMNGVVYAAFGGHCDIPSYRGWVVGVNAGTGSISTMWTDEAVPPAVNASPAGGIWHAGGRLVSDKNGEILLVSGNGVVPSAPLPGATPPPTLGESVIRLKVQPDGSLQAKDFFSPCNAQQLSDEDLDIGSGAPLALPDSFGTAAHPHLLMVVGKEGPIYLLNRDDLGGFQQGSPGSCVDGSGAPNDNLVSKFQLPNATGVWATPAMWPGEGGSIYLPYPKFPNGFEGRFTSYGVEKSGGQPTLTVTGQSSDNFGYGSSSAIITSNGGTSGTALAWIVFFADGSGAGAELRAYDPTPVNGVLTLRGAWPIGQGAKFNTPTVSGGRIYVGAVDGHVHAFGVTGASASQAPPPAPRSRVTSNGPGPDREG